MGTPCSHIVRPTIMVVNARPGLLAPKTSNSQCGYDACDDARAAVCPTRSNKRATMHTLWRSTTDPVSKLVIATQAFAKPSVLSKCVAEMTGNDLRIRTPCLAISQKLITRNSNVVTDVAQCVVYTVDAAYRVRCPDTDVAQHVVYTVNAAYMVCHPAFKATERTTSADENQ